MVDEYDLKFTDRLLDNLWDNVKGFFTEMFNAVWTDFVEFFPLLVKAFYAVIVDQFSNLEDNAWNNLLNGFVGAGVLTDEQTEYIKKLKDVGHPFDVLMFVFMSVTMLVSYISVQAEAGSNYVRQGNNQALRPNLPDYREILNAAFIAPEVTEVVREVMSKSGIPNEYQDLIFLSAYRLYSEETIKTLYLRGILDVDGMYNRMREMGYTDTRIAEIVQTWELIPGPQDLFWMVGKEAFEPDSIEQLGLADEFPTEQLEWLKKQGITQYWAEKYWFAHWDQPSIQQGYEMLHRGVIDFNTLNMLFRTVEIPPFWRDKLTQIAYMPYTRVDARRMHDTGVLKDEDLFKAYTDIGYDYEHALNMVKFTIAYNQQTQKDLTKSDILSSYKERIITYEDAKDLLMAIEYPEAQAEYLLEKEDYDYNRSLQEKLVTNIGDRYKENLITENEARDRLHKLNIESNRINVLVDSWNIDIYQDRKLPAKADLDKFYLGNIINEDQYFIEMKRLGYGSTYIGWYFELLEKEKGA